MGASKEYRDYILERLGTVTAVYSRAMFGGFGIYADDAMFGLISSDDVFYLKVDDSTRPDYEKEEMPQFHSMPYFRLPVEVLEDDEELKQWMTQSVEIGIRTKKKKKK
ncbi:MAG: TfoX/Sxy family protein [Chloroflexota bacterium]